MTTTITRAPGGRKGKGQRRVVTVRIPENVMPTIERMVEEHGYEARADLLVELILDGLDRIVEKPLPNGQGVLPLTG